jgi:hypothetical protein
MRTSLTSRREIRSLRTIENTKKSEEREKDGRRRRR